MMYEELIINLRNCAKLNGLSFYKRDLMAQAANVIEELSKRHECPCWYGDMRFCSLLGKTLPEPPEEEK